MKYKIGDRVKIRQSSPHYGSGDENPKDMIGVIVINNRGGIYEYKVAWPNNLSEQYRYEDLEPVNKRKISRKAIEHAIWIARTSGERDTPMESDMVIEMLIKELFGDE